MALYDDAAGQHLNGVYKVRPITEYAKLIDAFTPGGAPAFFVEFEIRHPDFDYQGDKISNFYSTHDNAIEYTAKDLQKLGWPGADWNQVGPLAGEFDALCGTWKKNNGQTVSQIKRLYAEGEEITTGPKPMDPSKASGVLARLNALTKAGQIAGMGAPKSKAPGGNGGRAPSRPAPPPQGVTPQTLNVKPEDVPF